MNRYERKYKGRRRVPSSKSRVPSSRFRVQNPEPETRNPAPKCPRVVAVGRIHKGVRETHVVFESMSPLGQAAVRRIFSSTARAEEIANL